MPRCNEFSGSQARVNSFCRSDLLPEHATRANVGRKQEGVQVV